MYYYLLTKLYNIFFVKEEKKELTLIIPDNLNISNHHPFECRPIRREPVARKPKYILELYSDSDSDSSDIHSEKPFKKAFEDFEENNKKEIEAISRICLNNYCIRVQT